MVWCPKTHVHNVVSQTCPYRHKYHFYGKSDWYALRIHPIWHYIKKRFHSLVLKLKHLLLYMPGRRYEQKRGKQDNNVIFFKKIWFALSKKNFTPWTSPYTGFKIKALHTKLLNRQSLPVLKIKKNVDAHNPPTKFWSLLLWTGDICPN